MLARLVGSVRRLALVLLLLGGCSSDPAKVGTAVGPEGGRVVHSSGAEVVVPAGALASETEITVELASSAPSPSGAVAVGATYRVGPEGLSFTKPVQIALPVALDKLPAGSSIAQVVVMTAPNNGSAADFAPLTTTSQGAAQVSAETTHFSLFVPALRSAPVSDGGTIKDAGAATCGLFACGGTGSGGCSCEETCEGHTFKMQCSAGTCACTVDGTQVKSFSGSCDDQTSAQAAWTSGCEFSGWTAPLDAGPAPAPDTAPLDAGPAPAPDTAPAACGPPLCSGVSSGGVSACSCEETCEGHTYKMQCSAGTCACTVDGTQVKSFSGSCDNQTSSQAAWTSGCGFPGWP